METIETEKILTAAEMFGIVGDELREKNAEIKQLRLANSDLQMHYDYARTECDNLTAQHKVLREATTDLLNAINGLFPTDGPVKARVRAALKEKE